MYLYLLYNYKKSWINPLLSVGFQKQLELQDLYSPVEEDESRPLIDKLETYFKLLKKY